MPQMASSSHNVENEDDPDKNGQADDSVTDRTKQSTVTDNSEEGHQDYDEQRKPGINQIFSDYWRAKNDGSQYQGSFSKSLKGKEALSWIDFKPCLKWLARQKDEHWDYANEDEFVAWKNLTSCSSLHLQLLKKSLLSLSSQCYVLRGPGGSLRGCITGLSTSTEPDFFHHPQAATISQHYGQLQNLYEQRTLLLFLHEYSCRCQKANNFVKRLGNMLDEDRFLLLDRSEVSEQSNFVLNLSLRAICEELQLHVSHWDLLWDKVHSEPSLRFVLFSRTQLLSSMQRAFWLLALQALLLTEDCIHTVLLALAVGQLEQGSRGAFEDILYSVELYNHTVVSWRSQHVDVDCTFQALLHCDCSWNRPSLSRPAPYPLQRLMRILAHRRAQIAAEQFYNWTFQQIDLLSLAGQPSKQWGCLEYFDSPVKPSVLSLDLAIDKDFFIFEAVPEKPHKKPFHSFSSSSFPFPTFIHSDRESLEMLFQVLVSSTDLLAPHVPKKCNLGRTDSVRCPRERSHQASVEEERLLKTPRMASNRHNAMQLLDLSKSDTCMELFSQYRDTLWRDFGKAVVWQFYYQSEKSVLGGVSQWNYPMMFLLVRWLKHACKEKHIPEECEEVFNKFCSHILSTAAFMRWDEMMCASLGLGLTDKCLPIASLKRSTTTTATIDLMLCHFAPLFSVLQLLQTPDPDSGTRSLSWYHFGLLCRTIATIQSSMLWVMSKAYQFLASWSLAKFLLVTQGDLKVLRGTAQSLVQQLESVGEGAGYHLMQLGQQLTWTVFQLQAFSDLALNNFSKDLKKMSVEIFEQTMPSAKHWRVNYKRELPSSPSDYAASAAQSVIGQVFQGVRPLPDEDRIPALVQAVTAFMEAWMEHILKQKIQFSIQGALQLKQDFDLIRDLIRFEYSHTEELPQSLLSLRVFHQVDSAVVCLLQQPVAKPYMPLRRWHFFRNCCRNRAQVVDQAAGSLNDLETMNIQAACHHALTQMEGSVTPKLVSTAPPESYLAADQQEWLDLRLHNGCRWKIPRLQCFTKSEP